MKTTINIPDELLEDARRASGQKTKTATIVQALENLVRQKKVAAVLESAGKLEFSDWEEGRHAR